MYPAETLKLIAQEAHQYASPFIRRDFNCRARRIASAFSVHCGLDHVNSTRVPQSSFASLSVRRR
jgi:hypothetical protein